MLKGLLTLLCFTAAAQGVFAATKYEASGTSSPSPLNLAGKGTITITPKVDLGDDVYIFSWCDAQSGFSMQWQDAINEKYRMTRNDDGSYSYPLRQSYQEWFKLSDEQCAGLKQIGVIARNTTKQTVNVYIDCIFQPVFFSGGIGTPGDPYQIGCADDLIYLSTHSTFWAPNTHFVQTASIQLDQAITPIGNESCPFKGHYDGDGYSITGLTVKTNPGHAAGLFGVADGATLEHVVVADCNVDGVGYVGALAGRAKDCQISQSLSSQGEVRSRLLATGGLVGVLEDGYMTDCYSSTNVSAPDEKAVGGLVGKNTGTITNCYATGHIYASNYAGGLVGANYGTVTNSAAINKSINAPGRFVGRFGGNNNTMNVSDGNYAWCDIPQQGDDAWSDFADHSDRPGLYPEVQSTYDDTLQWDFDNTWRWKKADVGGYPELRIIKDELPSPMPDELVSHIIPIAVEESDAVRIYNLQGIFMGESVDRLPHGIFIVKTGTKVRKIIH